jgi:hypothetical protein
MIGSGGGYIKDGWCLGMAKVNPIITVEYPDGSGMVWKQDRVPVDYSNLNSNNKKNDFWKDLIGETDRLVEVVNTAYVAVHELRIKQHISDALVTVSRKAKTADHKVGQSGAYNAVVDLCGERDVLLRTLLQLKTDIGRLQQGVSASAAGGQGAAAGLRDELEHSRETKQKVSDVTEVIYDGITYTKTARSFASLQNEAQYKESWDSLLAEIDILLPIAVNAVQKAQQLPLQSTLEIDRKVYARTPEYLDWSKQWNKGPASVTTQLTHLLRQRNEIFMTLVKAQREIDAENQKASVVNSEVHIVPDVAHTDAGQDDFEKNVLDILKCDKENALAKIRMLDSLQKCVLTELACEAGKEEDAVRQIPLALPEGYKMSTTCPTIPDNIKKMNQTITSLTEDVRIQRDEVAEVQAKIARILRPTVSASSVESIAESEADHDKQAIARLKLEAVQLGREKDQAKVEEERWRRTVAEMRTVIGDKRMNDAKGSHKDAIQALVDLADKKCPKCVMDKPTLDALTAVVGTANPVEGLRKYKHDNEVQIEYLMKLIDATSEGAIDTIVKQFEEFQKKDPLQSSQQKIILTAAGSSKMRLQLEAGVKSDLEEFKKKLNTAFGEYYNADGQLASIQAMFAAIKDAQDDLATFKHVIQSNIDNSWRGYDSHDVEDNVAEFVSDMTKKSHELKNAQKALGVWFTSNGDNATAAITKMIAEIEEVQGQLKSKNQKDVLEEITRLKDFETSVSDILPTKFKGVTIETKDFEKWKDEWQSHTDDMLHFERQLQKATGGHVSLAMSHTDFDDLMDNIEQVKGFLEIDKSGAILPRIQKMQTDMRAFEKTIEQFNSEQEGTVEDARKELVIVKGQLTQCESNLESKKKECASLTETIKQNERMLSKLEETTKALKGELEQLSEQCRATQTENRDLQFQLSRQLARVTQTQQDDSKFKQVVRGASTTTFELNDRARRLLQQLHNIIDPVKDGDDLTVVTQQIIDFITRVYSDKTEKGQCLGSIIDSILQSMSGLEDYDEGVHVLFDHLHEVAQKYSKPRALAKEVHEKREFDTDDTIHEGDDVVRRNQERTSSARNAAPLEESTHKPSEDSKDGARVASVQWHEDRFEPTNTNDHRWKSYASTSKSGNAKSTDRTEHASPAKSSRSSNAHPDIHTDSVTNWLRDLNSVWS